MSASIARRVFILVRIHSLHFPQRSSGEQSEVEREKNHSREGNAGFVPVIFDWGLATC
jgi:hypothetical protein